MIDRKKNVLLYATIKNGNIYEIFRNEEEFYLLSVNGQFIKKCKSKNDMYNFIRVNYKENLIF